MVGRLLLGAASSLTILIAGCETNVNAPPAKLAGTTWLAEDIGGAGVVDRVQSTVQFFDRQLAAGTLACNEYTTTYFADATGLRFGAIAATRKMCPPAVMEQEARFSSALEATRGLRFDATGALLLLDAEGKVRAKLTATKASS
jgi:heat shock protein HslJ